MIDVPQRIGPYEIRGELGRGGMGMVWLAWDPRLEREVAIKQLPPELARDPTTGLRFVSEARSAARLQHPGILPIYDVGESDGLPYFVMQRVEGGDLADHLEAVGRMSLSAALPLLRQIAAAIDHAHRAGVVHRDIKPENILLDRSGQALLTDFGIARAAENAGRGLTQAGALVGTPEYMSPEQAAGGAVDHRSDLYSFGIIAYQMFTGSVPFGGDSVVGVAMQHLRTPPPDPRRAAPELSAAAVQALGAMLAKDPAQRPASASEFVERLAADTAHPPLPSPVREVTFAGSALPVDPAQRLALALVVAALVLGLLLMAAALAGAPSQSAVGRRAVAESAPVPAEQEPDRKPLRIEQEGDLPPIRVPAGEAAAHALPSPAPESPRQAFEAVGVSLALPPDWEEAALPDGLSDVTEMGARGVAVKEASGLPLVVVLGFPQELSRLMLDGFDAKGGSVLDELLSSIEESLGGVPPAVDEAVEGAERVLRRAEWHGGRRVAAAKWMRVRGFHVDDSTGGGVADVIAARSEADSIYLIVAVAGADADLDAVQPILNSLSLGAVAPMED